MYRILALSLLAVATTAAAGQYDQPYAIIYTDTAKSSDHLLIPVIVNRVDGETIIDNHAVVQPGPHKVTVDVPPRRGFAQATQQTFDLEAKPCVRYAVSAKLASRTTQDWTPVVRYEERIGECEAKFKIATGK